MDVSPNIPLVKRTIIFIMQMNWNFFAYHSHAFLNHGLALLSMLLVIIYHCTHWSYTCMRTAISIACTRIKCFRNKFTYIRSWATSIYIKGESFSDVFSALSVSIIVSQIMSFCYLHEQVLILMCFVLVNEKKLIPEFTFDTRLYLRCRQQHAVIRCFILSSFQFS